MIVDFRWTCANYVYTFVDSFSFAAHHAFKSFVDEKKKIRLAASVSLQKEDPTQEDYDKAVTEIMESNCLATVIVTQTLPTAAIIYEARKRGYKGHFVIQAASMSIQGHIHRMAARDGLTTRDADLMLRGMHAVSPFNGVGTKRSAFMYLDMSMSGVRMRSTPPISITTAGTKPWRVLGGTKRPRQR